MKNSRKSLFVLLFLITVLCVGSLVAQTPTVLEVKRNVNLRGDPSTSHDPLDLLRPPARIELLEPGMQNGYYRVRTADGREGWVWSKNVSIAAPGDDTSLTWTEPVALPNNRIDPGWTKGIPRKSIFHGIEGNCGAEGDGSDPQQFILKNRDDVPQSYYDVTWRAIADLNYPGRDDRDQRGKPLRKNWTPDQLAVIEPFENIAVRVVGYLVAIKPQTGSGEGTNCDFTRNGDVDAHIALVENVGDAEKGAVVIEWTPRFLKAHPNWKKSKLMPWLDSDQPVRISGWLMFDPVHYGHLGRYRGTLWEIHPITKIEVFRDGRFVDIDQIP